MPLGPRLAPGRVKIPELKVDAVKLEYMIFFFLGGGGISVIKMSSALAQVKKFVILKENLNSHLLNTKYLG